MNVFDRLARWWVRRRSKRGALETAELREFVYLDEVSVYSLIASRLGSIAENYSSKQIDTLTSEVSNSIGANVPGFGTASVGSKMGASNASERQVLRKSTVQGAYRELREEVLKGNDLALPLDKVALEVGRNRRANSMKELETLGFAIAEATLTRGVAVELAVRLEPDESFSALTLIETLKMFENLIDIEDPNVAEGLETATALGSVLRSMLTGLVPVRGEAVDYIVLEEPSGDKRWVARRDAISLFPLGAITHPLIVTAVADQALFWKDVRRVLFGGLEYVVMGRVSAGGLRDTWSPVKLNNVLRRYVPDLAGQIDGLGALVGEVVRDSQVQVATAGHQRSFADALTLYGRSLATRSGVAVPADLEAIVSEIHLPSHLPGGPEEWRPLFDALVQRLPDEFHGVLTAEDEAVLRQECVDGIQSDLAADAAAVAISKARQHRSLEPVLDIELIAVHW